MIKIIVAIDSKRGLTKNGHTPWKLRKEMRYFIDLTRGETVLMGRKTYEIVGHPLRGRRNIVASRQKGLRLPGCEVVNKLDVLPENVWIIGGELFDQLIDRTDQLYITRVHADFNCDRFLPEYEAQFRLASRSEMHEEDGISFHYEIWDRGAHAPR